MRAGWGKLLWVWLPPPGCAGKTCRVSVPPSAAKQAGIYLCLKGLSSVSSLSSPLLHINTMVWMSYTYTWRGITLRSFVNLWLTKREGNSEALGQ